MAWSQASLARLSPSTSVACETANWEIPNVLSEAKTGLVESKSSNCPPSMNAYHALSGSGALLSVNQ